MTTQSDTPAPQWAVFRKKPVAIQAIQWTGDNLKEVIAFTGLHPSANKWTWEEYETVVREQGLRIFTLEDGPSQQVSHFASVGDWIIRGVKGELYPCKPDIFAATYEPTAPTAQPDEHSGNNIPNSCKDVGTSAKPAATGTPFIDIENRSDFRGNVIDATGTSIPAWLLEAVHDLRDMEIGSRFITDRRMSAMEDERWALFINGYMPKKPRSLPDAKEAQ